MRYTYAYKTSDGVRHEATMNASSREEVFSELRKRVKSDIEKARKTMSEADFMTYWEKRNDELRNLGIKTIGLGDE